MLNPIKRVMLNKYINIDKKAEEILNHKSYTLDKKYHMILDLYCDYFASTKQQNTKSKFLQVVDYYMNDIFYTTKQDRSQKYMKTAEKLYTQNFDTLNKCLIHIEKDEKYDESKMDPGDVDLANYLRFRAVSNAVDMPGYIQFTFAIDAYKRRNTDYQPGEE